MLILAFQYHDAADWERIKERQEVVLSFLHVLIYIADRGTVQKVIVLPKDDMETEELMLEEVEVFKVKFVYFK